MRATGLSRGLYIFPYGTHKDMNTPAMAEKYNQGPVGMMIVFKNGPPFMPKFLGLWFGYCLLVGFFVAYLAAHTIETQTFEPHTQYLAVFRIVGSAGFLAFGLGPSECYLEGLSLELRNKRGNRRPNLRAVNGRHLRLAWRRKFV